MNMTEFRRALLALTVAFCLFAAPGAVRAESQNAGVEAGLGIGAVVCTLFYAPAKIIYAGGGFVTAGLAWLLSGGNSKPMVPILTASVRGDYVVTPDNLRGRDRLDFVGRPPEYERLARRGLESETYSGDDGF